MATKNGVALNWGGFDRALSRAGHKLGDTQSLMEVVGETLESSTRQRFEEGKSPEGEPWEPSGRVRDRRQDAEQGRRPQEVHHQQGHAA